MDIKEALSQLDPLDDDQWTADGAPKIGVVKELVGGDVKRQDIIDAAPGFSRSNLIVEAEEAVVEEAPAPKVDNAVLSNLEAMDPPAQQQFVEDILKKADPSQYHTIEAFLLEQIKAIEEERSKAEELYRRTKINLATTRAYIKAFVPDMSNSEANAHYIAQSNKRRAEKAKELKEALGGLNPSDLQKLDPRAAIDRAFARKNARGAQRPKR